MKSEALRNIRTMRQITTGYDLARRRNVRTTNSLGKKEQETAHLLSLTDRRLGQILANENRRFAATEASIEKSRGRLLKAREKLAVTVNRNRALTELRYRLQRARWEKEEPASSPKEPPLEPGKLSRMELSY